MIPETVTVLEHREELHDIGPDDGFMAKIPKLQQQQQKWTQNMTASCAPSTVPEKPTELKGSL